MLRLASGCGGDSENCMPEPGAGGSQQHAPAGSAQPDDGAHIFIPEALFPSVPVS